MCFVQLEEGLADRGQRFLRGGGERFFHLLTRVAEERGLRFGGNAGLRFGVRQPPRFHRYGFAAFAFRAREIALRQCALLATTHPTTAPMSSAITLRRIVVTGMKG